MGRAGTSMCVDGSQCEVGEVVDFGRPKILAGALPNNDAGCDWLRLGGFDASFRHSETGEVFGYEITRFGNRFAVGPESMDSTSLPLALQGATSPFCKLTRISKGLSACCSKFNYLRSRYEANRCMH